ncbi:MIP family channel protein [Chitinophaga sp. SYP-B3965]|uniref:MIP family channel protein n=1 Tax=Chitinophaga sp. SYP-B3965 TaxID=2663120 RepID=UPI001299D453|nr:MIP family channel protein [Chitinophaga sp. SYP-B3965]MRG47648.1 MIP family channel protein [Chitinophaga sp. SYP-B3965]
MEIKSSTKYFAEMVGTFSLVLFGCGAAVVSGISTTGPAGIGLLGIAIAFGVAVVVMAYAIGGISGCHINPAITVAMLTAGKIKAADALGYIIAQFIGATIAAGVLYAIQKGLPGWMPGEWALGSNGWGPGYLAEYNIVSAFIAEAVLTFLFLFVIFGTTSKWGNGTMAGLAIGLTLVLIHLVAIPITGTSVNPARSFGPAVFAGGKALEQLWLFIVAPLVGAIAAAIVWRVLEKK